MTVWYISTFVLALLGVLIGMAAMLLERPKRKLVLTLRIVSVVVTLAGIVGGFYVATRTREPRHLNPKQVRMVTEALKPFAGQPAAWVFVRRTSPTQEARRLAQQILEAVAAAKWTPSYSDLSPNETTTGLLVSYDSLCHGGLEAAESLVSALRRCHLSVHGPYAASGRDLEASISVLVGEK